MIQGIGIDIIELDRIKALIQKNNQFTERILTEQELKNLVHLAEHRKVEYVAGRFAAKEAFAKSVGTGIGKLKFKDIEICNDPNGAPHMKVKGYADKTIHLSISHSKTYAVANVILEGE